MTARRTSTHFKIHGECRAMMPLTIQPHRNYTVNISGKPKQMDPAERFFEPESSV